VADSTGAALFVNGSANDGSQGVTINSYAPTLSLIDRSASSAGFRWRGDGNCLRLMSIIVTMAQHGTAI
jgi:hypothetical protein